MAANGWEDFDESQLPGDNGELYLFRWLSSAEQAMNDLTRAVALRQQSDLESILMKAIDSKDPYPIPGRALRNVIARCLIVLYRRGETRTLFDMLQKFIAITTEVKNQDKDETRIAAFFCVGELMAEFGAQFMSFMSDISTAALRTFKSSGSPLLRYHGLLSLQKSLRTASRAITEASARDIFKNMKIGLTDKALPVRRAAADVLLVMFTAKEHFISTADVESVIGICARGLDSVDQLTRHTFARLVGKLLATPPTDRTVAAPETSHHLKGDQIQSAEHPTPAVQLTEWSTNLSIVAVLTPISAQFNKPNASRKMRVGIFNFYSSLLTSLDHSFVEHNHATIVSHLMTEIVSKNTSTRYELLFVRHLVELLLRDLLGVRILSEQGQIEAIQGLSKSYLKRWPAIMHGQVAPPSPVLTVVLREVTGLLQQLGNAPPPVQDAVSEPLMTLLGHPSHSVRVNASRALQCFCYSTPLRLPKIIVAIMDDLQRDIALLSSPATSVDIGQKALGHAYGLASLVAIIPDRPLYVSYDVCAKVLDIAVQLLKSAADHDVKIADVGIEISWTLIAALMSLGPNFVRPHLPQLLVLWRNALPKPTSKDTANNTGRSVAEWMFLLHVRESALGAVLCFLRHCGALVTLDVARRIAALLGNALLFANNIPSQDLMDIIDLTDYSPRALPLWCREAMLRRRIYQCFTALGISHIPDAMQATLLQWTVTLFAGPDAYSGSSVQAAIVSSSGAFTSIWQSSDGYGYGVTSIDISEQQESFGNSAAVAKPLHRDPVEMALDSLLRKPVLGASEHDSLWLCDPPPSKSFQRCLEPTPPATSAVDAAIELFAQLFALQEPASIPRTVSQLSEYLNAVKAERNAGRKAAITVNTAIALALALRYATSRNTRQTRETLGAPQIAASISSLLRDALNDGDEVLRSAASEAIGRLASYADTAFLTNQTKFLVDQIVTNRDPHGRAGCALAFGAIYDHVGGLVAGPLLKTTVNVLMSLSSDPHPLVHYWALKALSRVIDAASLAYAPFVPSTLSLIMKVYTLESHEVEGGSLSNANACGDLPTYPVACQVIDAVITVLGPDIQESSRTRTLLQGLVREFLLEDDDSIRVEAIRCVQHLLMFAPEHIQLPELVGRFRGYLSSPRRLLKFASINALYQMVRKDALLMSRLGGDSLVEDLFGMLDNDDSVEGVRNVISSWLQQTVVHNPSAWIDLCQRTMSRTTASQRVAEAARNANMSRDDEGESLHTESAPGVGKTPSASRWRTQLFAMQCLHEICSIISRSERREHIDIPYARKGGIPINGLLVSRVTDLIKMAFTASTAYVTEIRLAGLTLLRDVIQTFATAPDPAFEGSLLLEQYQAPITAALTPAFSADSTPEILASAIQVCAIFVGSGVVKDINRMGRILKLLTTALEQLNSNGGLLLGAAEYSSPNASCMLRISTLSAWAQLQIASTQQGYLRAVVEPYRATLASLWVSLLRDFAVIRVDPEFLHDESLAAVDSSYSSLGRDVLLPYYANAWPKILRAVATSVAFGDPHIALAMDGMDTNPNNPRPGNSRATPEPCLFFFIIFGLVYEALANSGSESPDPSSNHQYVMTTALESLGYLARPEFSGRAFQEPAVFNELVNLSYRIAMTESASILNCLIEAMATLAMHQTDDDRGSPMSAAQLHCLRICTYVIRHSISYGTKQAISGDVSARIDMIVCAFAAIMRVAVTLAPSVREEIRGAAILLYSELLRDETPELDLIGPTLPALKSLLEQSTTELSGSAQKQYCQAVHGLLSTCLINIDAMSGRQGSVCSKIVKNNLLAAVLVLTVLPSFAQVSYIVIERCCCAITSYLLHGDEMVLTAAHCAKTLIIASNSGSTLLRHCTRLLIPNLIEYILGLVLQAPEMSIADYQMHAFSEIWRAFSSLLKSVDRPQSVSLLGVFLPTIAFLLNTPHSTPLAVSTTAYLLTLATSAPDVFREATTKLDHSTLELLEQTMRQALGTVSVVNIPTSSKPQISLRSF